MTYFKVLTDSEYKFPIQKTVVSNRSVVERMLLSHIRMRIHVEARVGMCIK